MSSPRWEPDGRDALSPALRMTLSILVTGALGFLLEYIGIEVLGAFENADPRTIWGATAVWALVLGPLLVVFRRSSILVPMAIVAGVFGFLVLLNHYAFMTWEFVAGSYEPTGLSSPRIWEFRDGALFGIRHPLLIALVAGAVETVVVPASVWLQKLITRPLRKPAPITVKQTRDTFSPGRVSHDVSKPERGFGFFFFSFIAYAYGIYFVYHIVGLVVGGRGLPLMSTFFVNPAETVNTTAKLFIMLSLAAVGAYNAKVRTEAALLLTIGHMISVVASLALYLGTRANPLFPMDQPTLLASVIGDGVLVLILLFYVLSPSTGGTIRRDLRDVELASPSTTLLRRLLLGIGVLFTVFTVAIVGFRTLSSPTSAFGAVFGGPDPLVSNSLTKYGTIAALGYFLYLRSGMRRYFIPTLVMTLFVTVAADIAFALQGSTEIITRHGEIVVIPWFMTQHIIVDGGGLMLLLAAVRMQYHSDYAVTALSPSSAECVLALHRCCRSRTRHSEESAREVLRRIDEQIVGMRGRRRGLLRFPFWLVENVFPPLLRFRPPFSTMSRAEQRFMLHRYVLRPSYERSRALIPGMAELMYQVGQICYALVTFAYYTTSNGQAETGYIPPDERTRLQGDFADSRPPGSGRAELPEGLDDPAARRPDPAPSDPPRRRLTPRTGSPGAPAELPDEVDFCVIGSGAGGAVMAYRLADALGSDDRICVVERGGYYSPEQDFTDDEMRMIRMLYAEGGLQTTRSFDFTILQGECVGGTTVVNNAVCVRMPEVTRNEWDVFGIDVPGLDGFYDRVQQELMIRPVDLNTVNHEVERRFREGVEGYNRVANGLGRLSSVERLDGNFDNCVGCGLCNIGCRRMRKLSMLETYVPWARARGATVVPGVGAVACETDDSGGGRKRVTALIVRKRDGGFARVRIRKALVVAAGAINSSRFLMRSELGGVGVGRGLSCNFAVPPAVEFPERIDAFDGLQIALYAVPESDEAIFEISFNPPGAYSIAMPLHFRAHQEMMDAYARSVNFTALVGSDPMGSVSRRRDLLFGRAVHWDPSPNDLLRIRKALRTIVGISHAAGARRVRLPTQPTYVLDLDDDPGAAMTRLEEGLVDDSVMNFVTAHPQGGNMMADSNHDERVVDTDFRVRDTENLFVCDASVFPRGVRVNPQWTVMALASMAAEHVKGLA